MEPELIDIDSSVESISLALDGSGNTHLSYEEASDLKYGFWDGAAWQTETVDNSGIVFASSLALDAADNPHMSYTVCLAEPCSHVHVRYAHRDGSGWQSEVVGGSIPIFLGLSASSPLALDAQGRPHIGFINEDDLSLELTHAYWDGNEWRFQVADTSPYGGFQTVSLDLDSSGNPHVFYAELDESTGTYFNYARWDGLSWQIETLDVSGNTDYAAISDVAMALDGEDDLHASYQEPAFNDLRYLTWAPNWQTRTLPEDGMAQSPAIDVETTIPYLGYYDLTGGQVKLANWDDAWELDPLDFVANPVSDLAVDAGTANEHVSFYDADNQRLIYAYRDHTGWRMEVVDEAGDVGGYNDLVLVGNNDGSPRIAYWDATSLRIKLAVPVFDSVLWDIHPNNAGPTLNADSGPLSAAVLPGGDIGVAYYDGVNDNLRLAIWDAETTTWTDELVDGGTTDVGRLNSLQADGTEGVPVVVYLEQGAIRLAYKLGGLWQTETAVPGVEGESMTSLSLELGLNSRQHARIAYTTDGGALNVANLRDGLWEIEAVESGAASLGEVTTARDSRLHLAYTH
ncbi:MAG: hypothetical protein ACRDIB_03980, partial [Ardenticatenaceae bacterium]